MLGPRVCWQLVFGWALLLSQPVFGDSDASEQPSLEDPKDLVSLAEKPEEPELAPEEPEEPELAPEEPEEPELAPEDPEEPELAPEEPEEPELAPEEPEEPELAPEESKESVPDKQELTSDEILERDEETKRKSIEEDISSPWGYWPQRIQRIALEHYQKDSEVYVQPFENANLRVEKAIGTIIHLKMELVKTNCSNDPQAKKLDDLRYFHHLYHADRYPKKCEPLSDSEAETQKCKFTIFVDARRQEFPIVIHSRCKPLDLRKKIHRRRHHIFY